MGMFLCSVLAVDCCCVAPCRQFSNRRHIARATLEAVCFQTREVLEAMNKDSGVPMKALKVDGGMSVNNLLLQLQADLLGIAVGM